RRMAFSVLVSNVDDHLRNHGVVWSPAEGFRLSPAFDINPSPPYHDRTTHGTTLRTDGISTMDFASVWAAAGDFLWKESNARTAVQQMVQAVANWAEEAKKACIPKAEVDRWSGAFEHEDFGVAMDIGQKKLVCVSGSAPDISVEASIASLERAFHNGQIQRLNDPDVLRKMSINAGLTATVRALVKDANMNAFALVEDEIGRTLAVPVSDADRDGIPIGESATFQVVDGAWHCVVMLPSAIRPEADVAKPAHQTSLDGGPS
ncbi:MAG: HipA domain-containing protein, partial [Acidithiobacillus sp.]